MGIETLVGASLGSTVAGGGLGLMGSLATGAANKDAAYYQAQVAQNNAVMADLQAKRLVSQGGEAVQEQGQKVGRMIGSQRASYAAAGVDVNSGTAAETQAQTAQLGRMDELRIFDEAMGKVYGARVQAQNYRNEAKLDKAKGDNAEIAGMLGGVTSLVNSAGSFSSKWAGFSRTGAVPAWGDN